MVAVRPRDLCLCSLSLLAGPVAAGWGWGNVRTMIINVLVTAKTADGWFRWEMDGCELSE